MRTWSTLKKLIWLKKTVLSAASWTYKTVTGSLIHILDAIAAPVSALSVDINPVQSGTGDPSPDNVRPITGWTEAKIWRDAVHDTTGNPVLTIDLDGTRYGGTLDVLTGVLTVTMASLDLGELSWGYNSINHFWRTSSGLSYIKAPATSGALANILCDKYAPRSYNNVYDNLAPNIIGISAANRVAVYLDGNQGDSPTGQLVYELATPQTIQLDPETLTLLSGENFVWCDTGDITLTYKAAEPNNKVGTAKVGTAKAG